MLEKDFWNRLSTFAPGDAIGLSDLGMRPPESTADIKLSLAVDACWFSFIQEEFASWEERARQKNYKGAIPAQNPLLRRRLIDAWIELEIARSVHEEALLMTAADPLVCARLARTWLIRCLKIFVFEIPLYADSIDEPWQKQARKFIQGISFNELRE